MWNRLRHSNERKTNADDSTIQVTDEDYDQVEGFLYYPHGEMITNGAAMNNQVNHLFAGHEYDQETGLYYMKARFYDPKTARFLTPDTIIPDPYRPSAYHRYAWVENDFLNATDPTGHFKVPSVSVNFDKPDWVKDLQHGADQTLQQTFSAFGQGVNQGLNNLAYGVNTFAHTASAFTKNMGSDFQNIDLRVPGTMLWDGIQRDIWGQLIERPAARNYTLTASGLGFVAGLACGAAASPSATGAAVAAGACSGAVYGYVTAKYEGKHPRDIAIRTFSYGVIGAIAGGIAYEVLGPAGNFGEWGGHLPGTYNRELMNAYFIRAGLGLSFSVILEEIFRPLVEDPSYWHERL
ncbi:MAG: RHS repeat-associated core domain-containing protein [SAR324 cluster bacterium]|nr:RHS repeat-associated core domain-containing protein [SAR324 cluster bacterium]